MTPPSAKPISRAFRWTVFAVVSFTCFAQYFVYDSLAPLMPILREQLGMSGFDYGLLSSAYSVANVFLFMLLFAGVVVDRMGIRFSGILFTTLCVAGAALTALGIARGEYWVTFAGRALFGLGAEAILLVNNKVLGRWFTGRQLAFSFGLNLTLLRAGSLLAGVSQAPLANRLGLEPSMFVPVGIMALGLLSLFAYLMLEKAAAGRPDAPTAPVGAPGISDASEAFRLREVFSFQSSFWFIALLCVAFYSAVFPFQAFASDMLVQRFGYSTDVGPIVSYSLTFATMIFTPIFGIVIDKYGKRASIMILGSLLLVPCHLMLALTSIPPVIPIVLVGVAFSLVPAALWASIPLMVPSARLGTAFGVIGYVQNVGLFAFPLLAGWILDRNTTNGVVDYTWTMLMFAALGVIGLIFALLFKRNDLANGSPLESPRGVLEQLVPDARSTAC